MSAPLVRILRIALGTALLAAVLIVLGSTNASAASGSSSASLKTASDKGLLSGILDPVGDLLDTTVQQVPVVKDITGPNTVGNLVAPVTGATDQLESNLTSVPVVGQVLTPVQGITTGVVTPVVQLADSVVTPTVGAVNQVTAPVLQITAPVLDPVTGAVKPVVDGVAGGAAELVDSVVTPVVSPLVPPAVPGGPGGAADVPSPTDPVTELPAGVDTLPAAPVLPSAPAAPAGGGAATESVDSPVQMDSPARVDGPVSTGAAQQAADASPQAATPGVLARYLAAAALPAFSTSVDGVGVQAPASSTAPAAIQACGSDSDGDAVGPCAPAATTAAASGSSSSLVSGGSGASGSAAAASEHFWSYFHNAGGAAQPLAADWPLPASMPENPGSTPG
ncbi:hypothetical protein ACFUCV_04645 [Specibacter sp. NPDC057265]|uniref:hypothetical protein n=1 Tax=Specibacter sp. NPDC057265 TaxID=3346075 RepID=UPI00362AE538